MFSVYTLKYCLFCGGSLLSTPLCLIMFASLRLTVNTPSGLLPENKAPENPFVKVTNGFSGALVVNASV